MYLYCKVCAVQYASLVWECYCFLFSDYVSLIDTSTDIFAIYIVYSIQ